MFKICVSLQLPHIKLLEMETKLNSGVGQGREGGNARLFWWSNVLGAKILVSHVGCAAGKFYPTWLWTSCDGWAGWLLLSATSGREGESRPGRGKDQIPSTHWIGAWNALAAGAWLLGHPAQVQESHRDTVHFGVGKAFISWNNSLCATIIIIFSQRLLKMNVTLRCLLLPFSC